MLAVAEAEQVIAAVQAGVQGLGGLALGDGVALALRRAPNLNKVIPVRGAAGASGRLAGEGELKGHPGRIGCKGMAGMVQRAVVIADRGGGGLALGCHLGCARQWRAACRAGLQERAALQGARNAAKTGSALRD